MVELDISEMHEQMLEQLREHHGDDVDEDLTRLLEEQIHQAVQALRYPESDGPSQ
jgi:hypothetical protein